jgi:hypothetical protein
MEGWSKAFGWHEKLIGDSAYQMKDKTWQIITNRAGQFFTETFLTVADTGFVGTKAGSVVKVTESEVSKIDGAGICEAMARDKDGSVFGSFVGVGICELQNDRWKLVMKSPYSDQEQDHEIYLAASGGRIAVAVVPNDPIRSGNLSRPQLVVSEGREWKPLITGTICESR